MRPEIKFLIVSVLLMPLTAFFTGRFAIANESTDPILFAGIAVFAQMMLSYVVCMLIISHDYQKKLMEPYNADI